MRNRLTHRVIAGAAGRVPGLRRLPVFRLLALAELALVARDHYGRLSPGERGRLVVLVRQGRGRNSRNLTPEEREELAGILAKVEPRRFAGLALDRLSPVPLPHRLVYGRAKR